MRELEKNSPVPVRKEMSITEYSKLVDTNANLVDKIKEQQEIIKKMQENQDSAIKIMKMYKDYKLRVDKAIEIYEKRNTCEYKKKRFMEDKSTSYLMYEILKGEDKQ